MRSFSNNMVIFVVLLVGADVYTPNAGGSINDKRRYGSKS